MNFIDYQALAAEAVKQLGKAYLWGAKPNASNDNPDNFDCSGFVHWLYSRQGLVVPEGSEDQLFASAPVKYNLHTGDVGFFIDAGTGQSKHVGLLLDKDTVIEARGLEPSLEAQGIKTNRVIMRPRANWENWKEFSGWRRFVIIA